ncbi:MAG: flagellar biosynthesis protein FliQ [Thalassovita sp.]
MDFDANIEQLQIAYWKILLTAGPVLGVALAVGLTVGIIQAATSINEATLSFVPKLAIVLVTMGLASTFMLTSLSDYFVHIFDMVAGMR